MKIIIEKATGKVIDVGNDTLTYNPDKYDNETFPDGTIPADENYRKYMRGGGGTIVKRLAADLNIEFPDEAKAYWHGRVNALPITAVALELKAFLNDFVDQVVR